MKVQDMLQRQAFEEKIVTDRCDSTTRLVYADWLDEHDLPEAAYEQRRCASDRWVGAARWMELLAHTSGETCVKNYGQANTYDHSTGTWTPTGKEEEWKKITFEDLIEAGRTCAASDGDDVFVQTGEDSLRGIINTREMIERFWEMWSIITGEWHQGDAPFGCSC